HRLEGVGREQQIQCEVIATADLVDPPNAGPIRKTHRCGGKSEPQRRHGLEDRLDIIGEHEQIDVRSGAWNAVNSEGERTHERVVELRGLETAYDPFELVEQVHGGTLPDSD